MVRESRALPFRKVDLHIHTPKSACYSDMSVTPEEIVDAALSDGLEAIAITDHNTVEGIEGVSQAAAERGLHVFPGIELSTAGGHILALFPADMLIEDLRDFLDYVGVDREGQGDAVTQTRGEIENVLWKVEERGGLAIAAHVERWPSGFLETNQPRRVKRAIHGSDHLSALEITVPQNKGAWNNGEMRGYPKRRACVQGSDAHALEDIGRRPVYIRMGNITLDALRVALCAHGTEVAFPGELCRRQ